MKYFLILGLLLIIGGQALAQSPREFTVPLSQQGKRGELQVKILSGSITVTGTPRQDVKVQYQSREGEDLKITDAGNGLKKISGGMPNLSITENDNTVNVKSESWEKTVDITVEVPQGFDLQLSTYNDGEIVISNVEGEIEIENFNGGITANSISGSLVGNSYNGNVVVTFKKVAPDTPMAFTSFNGNIDISLPATTKANLKMKSESGDIYTGFDIDPQQAKVKNEQEDSKNNGFKTYVDGWVTGKINGGGPEIMIKNYFGDIFVRNQ